MLQFFKIKKIIYNYGSTNWELYNLQTDPFEKNNLVTKEQEVAKRMGRSLVEILDLQGADYPVDLKTGKPVKPDLSKI